MRSPLLDERSLGLASLYNLFTKPIGICNGARAFFSKTDSVQLIIDKTDSVQLILNNIEWDKLYIVYEPRA